MAFEPVTAIVELGSKLIDRFWQDPATKDAAKLELFKAQQNGELAVMANDTMLLKMQADINIEEAKNENVFVSGWRPFIGWISGCGLAYQYLIYPILIAFIPKIMPLEMSTLIGLLGGMLGLGGLRTYEKKKGIA